MDSTPGSGRSIPSSGTTSEPHQCPPVSDNAPAPVRKTRCTPVAVSFAPNVVIVSTPARSSQMVGPVSPDLLQASRELFIPSSQCDTLNSGPAAILIAPPSYVLFPFDDPFDGVDSVSTPRFPLLLALPGFALIGPPGSLAMPQFMWI